MKKQNKQELVLLKDKIANKIFTDKRCWHFVREITHQITGMSKDSLNNMELKPIKISINSNIKQQEVDAIFELDNYILNLETNYTGGESLEFKNRTYICQLILSQTKSGKDYPTKDNYKKIIQICIDYYDKYGKNRYIYKESEMEETFYLKHNELYEIYHFNIYKLSKVGYNNIEKLEENDLLRLMYVFICDNEKREKLYANSKIMEGVVKKMSELTSSLDELLFYNREELYKRSAKYEIKRAREKGIEQGITKGLEQGITKGIEQGKLENMNAIAKNMLNAKVPPKDIAKYTSMSEKDVLKLAKSLAV